MISLGFPLLVCVILFAFGIVVALKRRTTAPTDSTCGKCGYQVRGLTTFTCPECGSDLREVGIISAGRPTNLGLSTKLIIGAAAWAPVAICFTALMTASASHDSLRTIFTLIAVLIDLVALILLFAWIVRRHNASAKPFATPSQSHLSRAGTRNLSIVFVDMHDYTSRVARESRDGVIELVRRTREMIQPIVQQRHGKIVKTIGDAFLITFESPTDAILTSREIQSAMSKSNAAIGDDDHVQLRIGISTGEVAIEHNDVYGDPVNIANRIQQIAQPGEILFNEATFHAMKRSEVPHEIAGDFDLKGVNGRVKLYRTIA